MRQFLYVAIVTVLFSCQESRTDKHEDLISFKSKFHRDLTDKEIDNGAVVKTEINDSIGSDILYITLIVGQSGCMTFDGDIDIQGDTIYLEYWHSGNEACDEYVVYKMDYQIKNLGQKKYVIQRELSSTNRYK